MSVELDAELAHRQCPGRRIRLEQLLGQREPDPQHHQPLLRPVVQVALDPRPLLIGGLRDPPARLLELTQGAAEPRGAAIPAHRAQHERADRGQQLVVGPQLRVVREGHRRVARDRRTP